MRYTFDSFEVDLQLFELRHNGERCKLEPQEFNVLAYLIEHRNQIVTKDELLEHVWPDQFVSEATLSSRIKTLRRALGDSGRQQRYIKTIHGRGYRFVSDLKLVTPELLSDLTDDARSPAAPSSVSPAPLASSISPEVAPETAEIQTSPAPSAPPVAERRQLTILFCDLVGSTLLSEQLDPEDLDEVLQAYYAACDEAITSFGGHVAQYLGDGLLVYFGYPHAQEDAARRAAHAGLDVLQAISTLNRRLESDYGLRLDVRIGIHTGLVIVGEGRSGGRAEQLAVGAAPNIASRIQALSAPNTVLVSEATQTLISGYFVLDDMGRHELEGLVEPMPLYQVIAASETQHRLDVSGANRLTPFVGRDLERIALQHHWEQVQHGEGHVVIVSGEAGIGKSRLARALIEGMSGETHLLLEGHCSPYHQHTAFYPLADMLRKHLGLDAHAASCDPITVLARFAHDCQLDEGQTVPALATLLGLPYPRDLYAELALSPPEQRQFIFETLLHLVLFLAQDQPLLFFIEDGHWLDPSTLEWLNLLVDQGPTVSVLTLITTRPEFVVPWQGRAHVTILTLNQLSAAHITEIAQSIAGAATVAREFIERIVNTTDGVPLFAEEMTRLIVESGSADRLEVGVAPQSSETRIEIPATLQDLLISRLDGLGAAKRTAQVAATIGREFSFELLQVVSPLDEASLRHDLETLLTSDLLYQRGLGQRIAYQFKHALIQEAAYASQLRRTRQQRHQRIADALATSVHDVQDVGLEVIAYHYTKAGATEEAVTSWLRAGEQAAQYSAHLEAIAHLRQGLDLLQQLPESPARNRQELDFQMALGQALMMTEGFAAVTVEEAYRRAQALYDLVEVPPSSQFVVLQALLHCYVVRAEHHTAQSIGEQLLDLATRQQDDTLLHASYFELGIPQYFLGYFDAVRSNWERSLALCSPHYLVQGVHIGTFCPSWLSHALSHMGYEDQALAHCHATLTWAQHLTARFDRVLALAYAMMLHQFRGDVTRVEELGDELAELCREQEFAYYESWGTILLGWVQTVQGQGERGISQIHQGLDALQQTGGQARLPYYLALLADAFANVGQPEEGCRVLDQAISQVQKTNERWYEAELYRLKGEFRQQVELTPPDASDQAEVEACFSQALEIARQQKAKSWKLRAATSLAQLWQQQGNRQAARELLTPVYDGFTEGFDTPHVKTAKALLDALQ